MWLSIPRIARQITAPLAAALTKPTCARLVLLLLGAILTLGHRTVSNILRILGRLAPGHPSSYHRVLSHRRAWGWKLACIVASLVMDRGMVRWPATPSGDRYRHRTLVPGRPATRADPLGLRPRSDGHPPRRILLHHRCAAFCPSRRRNVHRPLVDRSDVRRAPCPSGAREHTGLVQEDRAACGPLAARLVHDRRTVLSSITETLAERAECELGRLVSNCNCNTLRGRGAQHFARPQTLFDGKNGQTCTLPLRAWPSGHMSARCI